MEMLEKYLNLHPSILPRLSPDGTKLAFVRNDGRAAQIWLASAAEFSAPRQLTRNESGVTILDWTADGGHVAFAADLDGDERQGYYLAAADGKTRTTLLAPGDSYRVWGGFSPAGGVFAYAENRPGTLDFDLYVRETSGGRAEKVYQKGGVLFPASWHPDGAGLLLLRVVAADANEVCYLDLQTREIETLLSPAEPSYHNFFSWKPDAGGFFLATNAERDFGGAGYFDLAEKRFSRRRAPARDVECVFLSPSGKYLSWFENDDGYSELFVENLETGEISAPADLPRGVVEEIRWAKDADKLAIELTGPQRAGDIWIYEPGTNKLFCAARSESDQETKINEFVFPAAVAFPAHDGETIHGLLYEPKNAAQAPVVIHLHGGPAMQARPRYDAFHQYLVESGIAVFDLNYRGSTGYGKRYMRLDNRLLRKDAVRDIASATDFLRQNTNLDCRKIALVGESYGGFMVLAGLTAFPDSFVCGVDVVGVCDWLTALENTLPQLMAADAEEYGDVRDEAVREFLYDLSPINHLDKIRAPLLVIHGRNDPRVPVAQAHEIVDSLARRGSPVELLIFEDEGHSIAKLTNRLKSCRKIAEFLDRHLSGADVSHSQSSKCIDKISWQ